MKANNPLNRPIAEVAKGMSKVAAEETPWFAVYVPPQNADGPQVDQMWAVFRDDDSAYRYLDEIEKRRTKGAYIRPIRLADLPVYVPTQSQE